MKKYRINYGGANYTAKGAMNTILYGELGWGESYVNGDISVDGLKEFLLKNQNINKFKGLYRKRRRGLEETHLHYNINPKHYETMLGSTMSYTCAMWDGVDNLNDAQLQKLKHHYDCIEVKQDSKLLDIGCGWGSFINYTHQKGVVKDITAINIAQGQINYIAKNNPGKYKLHNCNWSQFYPETKYDRVAILGCIEHIGRHNFHKFFKHLFNITTDDAIITIQCISSDRDAKINAWTNRYIFPGAETPSINELFSIAELTGFGVDYGTLRQDGLDYSKTTKEWLKNINPSSISLQEYRMWELYLTGCQVTFETRNCLLTRFVLRKR